MDTTFVVGIVLSVGLLLGEIAERLRLPKITGYIIAGILLDPKVSHLLPEAFTEHTQFITNIALSFITFLIGGTLMASRLRELGKKIVAITLFEAEVTFFAVAAGVAFILPLFVHNLHGTFMATFVPVGLIIGALASPTDPSGTIAVVHQYKARGEVTSTILSVSAFDDAIGLMNFSLAVVIAKVLVTHQSFNAYNSFLYPLMQIGGAVLLGLAFGLVLNIIERLLIKEPGGVLIVMVFALLTLCFGVAGWLGVDQLLATMTMGIVVTNFSKHRDHIFSVLTEYTEELVFVVFFTLSGMYLDLGVLASSIVLVALYTFWRTAGKFAGTYIGASISDASGPIKRYTALGLIPSGGIIVGLAIVLKQTPAFDPFSDIVLNVIIGATVIHELAGPILVQFALTRTKEIA
jgi:Kef-type K+ transport system membrane component KefB